MTGKSLLLGLAGLILVGCASDQQWAGTGPNPDPRLGTLNASVFEGGPPVDPPPTTTAEYLANGQIPPRR